MGTRADFYIGRGPTAEWLGSIAWDGYPDGISRNVLVAKSEVEYRAELAAFVAGRDDWTEPSMGWPWPWDTSHTTDFAYALEGDTVYGSCFGGTWFVATEEVPDDETETESVVGASFPDMAARKNVTFGKRSGVMIISAPRSEKL